MRHIWLILTWFALGSPVQGQTFVFTQHHAFLWKHTYKLSIETGQYVPGFEAGILLPTSGKKQWHNWQRFPGMSLQFLYFKTGEGAHRSVSGLLPAFDIPLVKRRAFRACFRIGAGVAYVSRPYNYFLTPTQNAIGSHLNALVQFRFEGALALKSPFSLRAGLGLTHYSNGGSTLPNYGINLPSANWCLAYTLNKEQNSVSATAQQPRLSRSLGGARRLGILAHFGLTRIEHNSFDGPRYRVWQAGAAVVWQENRIHQSSLGFDLEYNEAIYALRLHLGDFTDEKEARQGSTRIAVQAGHEFLFGDLSIWLSGGYYLGDKKWNRFTLAPWYSKLGIRYYFPMPDSFPFRPYLSATLKAHLVIAEYFSLNAGFINRF